MTPLLSIDPGSATSGWLLVSREGARVRYLTSGTCASTPRAFLTVLDTVATLTKLPHRSAAGTIALEVAEGMVFAPYRAPALLKTAEMVGVITALAHDIGIPLVRFTAGQVRKALVGKASSPKKGVMDKLVGDAVRANVVGWPVGSNVHVRDAAALAVVANWQLVSRRVA
jgi:Holliday junction resolvasome RuvABC endonuclease subunit